MENKIQVYRIEKPIDKDGMWYDSEGNPKKQIHELCPNGIAKDFPMPYNNLHRKEGKVWCSAGKCVETMKHWFTAEDAQSLLDKGFKLYAITVPRVQELEFESLFCREEIIEQREIELTEVWDELNLDATKIITTFVTVLPSSL